MHIYSNILSDGVVSKPLVYERRLEFTIVKKLLSVVIAEPIVTTSSANKKDRAVIFKKSMGARHRGGIGFSYRPARLQRLAEFIPWNQFRGPINF
jgi:hypothetical protein